MIWLTDLRSRATINEPSGLPEGGWQFKGEKRWSKHPCEAGELDEA
jgi:hypothetical protein